MASTSSFINPPAGSPSALSAALDAVSAHEQRILEHTTAINGRIAEFHRLSAAYRFGNGYYEKIQAVYYDHCAPMIAQYNEMNRQMGLLRDKVRIEEQRLLAERSPITSVSALAPSGHVPAPVSPLPSPLSWAISPSSQGTSTPTSGGSREGDGGDDTSIVITTIIQIRGRETTQTGSWLHRESMPSTSDYSSDGSRNSSSEATSNATAITTPGSSPTNRSSSTTPTSSGYTTAGSSTLTSLTLPTLPSPDDVAESEGNWPLIDAAIERMVASIESGLDDYWERRLQSEELRRERLGPDRAAALARWVFEERPGYLRTQREAERALEERRAARLETLRNSTRNSTLDPRASEFTSVHATAYLPQSPVLEAWTLDPEASEFVPRERTEETEREMRAAIGQSWVDEYDDEFGRWNR